MSEYCSMCKMIDGELLLESVLGKLGLCGHNSSVAEENIDPWDGQFRERFFDRSEREHVELHKGELSGVPGACRCFNCLICPLLIAACEIDMGWIVFCELLDSFLADSSSAWGCALAFLNTLDARNQ